MNLISNSPGRKRAVALLAGAGSLLAAATAGPPEAVLSHPPVDPTRLSSSGYLRWFGAEPPAEMSQARLSDRAQLHAELDPKVMASVRLGDDPAQLPADQQAQAEPHIARSFTDPNLLVATFQEGRFADGGAVNCGYAISTNAGTSWRRALIPHLVTSIDDGRFARVSDPVAAVGPDNTIYLNTLGLEGGSGDFQASLVLSRSDDGGASFSEPLTVRAADSNPALFIDKNWMAVNTFPGTRHAGRIVVTYTLFDSTLAGSTTTPIYATFSDDRGTHWSVPARISPPSCQGSQPVFLPDGSLAVGYWNFEAEGRAQIEVVISADGGGSFGSPHPVARPQLHNDPVARNGAFLPSFTADRGLGVLYAAWQGLSGSPSVLFSRSLDRGLTWSVPARVNDTPDGRSVFNPAIAVAPDGQHVTIVFHDKRHDPGEGFLYDTYLAESFDGGETWPPNVRLSSESSDLRRAPRTAGGYMVGDYLGIVPALNLDSPVWAVWVDARSASPDPYAAAIRRSRGGRFADWQKLAFPPGAGVNALAAGPEADPDHDGLPNLIEYAGGLDPRRPDEDPVRFTQTAGELQLSFRSIAALDDVEVADWRASEDLRNWSPTEPERGASAEVNGVFRQYRAGFATTNVARHFTPGARLTVP